MNVIGCDMDVGFRVQYSDLAMLQWVQVQVLSADQTIVVDKLDNSTRTEWDGKKQKGKKNALAFFDLWFLCHTLLTGCIDVVGMNIYFL